MLAFVLTTFIFSFAQTTDVQSFPSAGITTLRVSNQMGKISILPSTSSKTTVSADKVSFPSHCKLLVDKKDSTLNVEVQGDSGWSKSPCNVNFSIKSPQKINIQASTGAGDLNIQGTSGTISFTLGNGDTEINADVLDIQGRTGSGNITVYGLHKNGDFKTGSGEVKLSYKTDPQQATLDIRSGSGDAVIYLPKTAQFNTNFFAGSGKFMSEFNEKSDSPFVISMKTGSGDLNIKKQ